MVSECFWFWCFFRQRVLLCSSCWHWTHHIAQANLELLEILLLKPPESWDYTRLEHAPPGLAVLSLDGVQETVDTTTRQKTATFEIEEIKVFAFTQHDYFIENLKETTKKIFSKQINETKTPTNSMHSCFQDIRLTHRKFNHISLHWQWLLGTKI